jgi:phosphoglycolate phosphatase
MDQTEKYRGLALFDLDGTLTESGPGIMKSIEAALRKQGITDYTEKQIRACIGPPLYDSFRDQFGMSGAAVEQAVADYRERYGRVGIFENRLYDGVREMLEMLARNRILTGLASSKPEFYVRQILAHFQIDGLFPVVTGATADEKLVEKPDIIRLAIRRAAPFFPIGELTKDRIWMAGDRFYDVNGAKACGIRCVGVTYGYGSRMELEKAGADAIASTPEELGRILLAKMRVKEEGRDDEQMG